MKHLFVFAIAIVGSLVLNAQSEKYVNAMNKNIAELDSAHDAARLAELANNPETRKTVRGLRVDDSKRP